MKSLKYLWFAPELTYLHGFAPKITQSLVIRGVKGIDKKLANNRFRAVILALFAKYPPIPPPDRPISPKRI